MDEFKGKRIEKPEELVIDSIYIMENQPCKLLFISKNRFVFQCPDGVEHINRAMLETRIKQGLFQILE